MILPYLSGSRNDLPGTAVWLSASSVSERSSVLGFFSRSVWKSKREGEIKQKVKRQNISGISKIFAWSRK
ncbi:hypothetical protein AAHA92_28680 [Salvia divinorum]|uniref:Uncharacterized protein n=1 Tax=Salvia divinorum TaxID=28513 RepID=A0ABD1FVV7_SALDI